MIDRLTVDRIFAAANIVEIVGEFVTLHKKGVNYQACCPFHNERTPSFVVSPSKGLFKCFGCGKGGNSVTFVMEHEGIGYVEALKYIAKKYGIDVQERELSPEEQQRNDDRESMMVVNSFAADWFKEQITTTDEGRSVGLSYFRQRGFTDATIEKFGLGYCPEAGDSMTQAALKAGYKEEFLISTGLTGKRETGRIFDRFYGRVIFPIHTVSGRVIAFGGRTLRTDKKLAKYVNSPESEIYHKSNVLYGLYFGKKAITQEDCCILVEGYTDVISMHQSGVENVVASSGTSLTTDQIRLISRFTKNITVIYDGDAAGIKASLRGIDMILREGLNVRVVPLPPEDDPDSFARKHSAQQVKEYITANEEDFITFKTRILLTDAGRDPIKRAELVSDIVGSIAEVPDPIMRSMYVRETARNLDTEHELIASEVARKRISAGTDKQTREFIRNQQQLYRDRTPQHQTPPVPLSGEPVSAGSNMDELEKELVKYLIKYGHLDFDYKEGKTMVSLNVAGLIINDLQADNLVLSNPKYKALYESYLEYYNEKEESEDEGPYDRYGEKTGGSGEQESSPVDMSRFINHPDPEVCNAAVDILTEQDHYIVSKMWEKKDIVVTSEQDQLAEIVPRAIILYKSKAVEKIIAELLTKLSGDEVSDDDISDITARIDQLNNVRRTIANKLSRLIL